MPFLVFGGLVFYFMSQESSLNESIAGGSFSVGLSTAVGVSFGSGLIADAPESTLPEDTPLL